MGLQCHTAIGKDFEVLLLLVREARTATQTSNGKEGGEVTQAEKKLTCSRRKVIRIGKLEEIFL